MYLSKLLNMFIYETLDIVINKELTSITDVNIINRSKKFFFVSAASPIASHSRRDNRRRRKVVAPRPQTVTSDADNMSQGW